MTQPLTILLVLLPCLLSACTFGEGPELDLPESSETLANVTTAANTQLVNTQTDSASTVEPSADPTGVANTSATVETSTSTETDSTETDSTGINSTGTNGSSSQTNDSQTEAIGEPHIVRIPSTDSANAPQIDGSAINYIDGTGLLDGEWRFAAQSTASSEPLDIDNRMFGDASLQGAVRHHWAAMHDAVYLYLLIVSDDAGVHYQDTGEVRKPWKDDSIEIYIDGNNSQLDSYDGVDDFHMTINLQSSTGVANSSFGDAATILQSDASATLPSDLNFAIGLQQGPIARGLRGRKDIYEVRIKLSELNITLEQPFGIEIQINDDDNGGTRDTKWGWHHPSGTDSNNDYTWQNPSVMGRAVLVR